MTCTSNRYGVSLKDFEQRGLNDAAMHRQVTAAQRIVLSNRIAHVVRNAEIVADCTRLCEMTKRTEGGGRKRTESEVAQGGVGAQHVREDADFVAANAKDRASHFERPQRLISRQRIAKRHNARIAPVAD